MEITVTSTYTYPGVYIEEVPSGVRTIIGVPTSITAFVGRTLTGPVDEPVRIQNLGDFQRVFGGLWYESPLTYAIQQYFLNGGNDAIIVRLYSPSSSSSTGKAHISIPPSDVNESESGTARSSRRRAADSEPPAAAPL